MDCWTGPFVGLCYVSRPRSASPRNSPPYLLFAATVIEFFEPGKIAERLRRPEASGSGAKSLDTLAAARQCLPMSPGMSLHHIRRFRTGWCL